MATPVTTATGRNVWGNPFEKVAVIDDKTKTQAIDPKTGQPIWEYAFGLAIAKADFGPIWAAMTQEGAKVNNGVAPEYNPGARNAFAYKFVDGDTMAPAVPERGIPSKPYADREGYGGCYVLAIKSRLDNPPPLFVWANNTWTQADPNNILGGNKFKTGDYVQVGLSIDGHGGQSPGLYLNPQGIQFVGFGTQIMRGPDAATMFGAGPAALPAGASAAPVAPVAPPPAMPGNGSPASTPAMPGAPAAVPAPANSAPMPGNSPAMPTALPSSVPAAPAPVPGFAAGMPGQPAAPAAPAAPATPAAPPPPPAPVAPAETRQFVGNDAAGRPYYLNTLTGQTEY